MAATILTTKQQEELNYSIISYFKQLNYQQALDAFSADSKLSVDSIDGVDKYAGLLERKWTSVIRLQKKVMDLEQKLHVALDELSSYGSSSASKKPASNLLQLIPRSPEKLFLSGHRAPITCIAFHPVFNVVASSSEDCAIKIWDLDNNGQVECSLKGHTKSILGIAYHPNGDILVSCSADLTVKIWDAQQEYKCVKTLHGHDHSISAIAFLPTNGGADSIVTASRDKSIKMWNVASGYCTRTFVGHEEWVRSVSSSQDGLFIVSASNDQSIRVWDVASGDCKAVLRGHEHVVECAVFVPVGAYPALQEFINPSTASTTDKTTTTTTTSQQQSLPGPYVVSGSRDKSIRIWDVGTEQCLKVLTGHDNWIRSLDFLISTGPASATTSTASGSSATAANSGTNLLAFLVSVSDDKTMKIWDLNTGRCTRTIDAHSHFVSALAVRNTGRQGTQVATGGVDQLLKIWTPL